MKVYAVTISAVEMAPSPGAAVRQFVAWVKDNDGQIPFEVCDNRTGKSLGRYFEDGRKAE